MNRVDFTAFCGPYPRRPIGQEPAELFRRLAEFGVDRVFASRLEALWFENPHDANRLAESASDAPPGLIRTPVLDPSLGTWREELDRLAARGPLPIVRLHPNYHGYTLADAAPALAALATRGVIAQIVVRVDDPRRQHPRAQVPDVPPATIREAAARHPKLKILLSGASTPALNALTKDMPTARNLWADTSQADGSDAVAGLMRGPWRDRLVFGTHAPLFLPEAAFARVVLDLDDASADLILRGNAVAFLS